MGADSITWRIVRSEGETVPITVRARRRWSGETKTVYPKPEVPEKANWWNPQEPARDRHPARASSRWWRRWSRARRPRKPGCNRTTSSRRSTASRSTRSRRHLRLRRKTIRPGAYTLDRRARKATRLHLPFQPDGVRIDEVISRQPGRKPPACKEGRRRHSAWMARPMSDITQIIDYIGRTPASRSRSHVRAGTRTRSDVHRDAA